MNNSSTTPEIHVTHYQRKADGCQFSLERVFHTIREALPPDVSAVPSEGRFSSHGILRRLLMLIEAPLHQGDVNHITGDIHFVALTLPRQKTILTIHDCVSLHFSKGLTYARILWFWYRLPVRHVAAITVISEFSRRELMRYVRCDPRIVHVIPNPVSSDFVPWPKDFDSQCPALLQVGTAEHNKNICRLAEALRGIQCRLEIIGTLTERQKHALEANAIVYSSWSGLSDAEVVQRYRECDIVVFASTYEGFGLPIIEAHATGRPVITSNLGPMPEVAGRAACLVNPFDSSSIREALLRVIGDADYRRRLVAEGFENVKRFRAERIAAQYAALYREVFTKSGHRKPQKATSSGWSIVAKGSSR